MINEPKKTAINLILQGLPKADIAKVLNVNRSTLYVWLNETDFISEMETQRKKLLQNARKKLTNRVDTYLDILHKLAITSTDEKIQALTTMYLLDHIIEKYIGEIIKFILKDYSKKEYL